MLSFIIDLVLSSALISAVIFLLLCVKRPMKKFSAGCRYIIWSLVIIILCIPVSIFPKFVDISFSNTKETKDISSSDIAAEDNIDTPRPIYSKEYYAADIIYEDGIELDSHDEKEDVPEASGASADNTFVTVKEKNVEKKALFISSENLGAVLLAVWAAGAFVLFSVSILKYRKNIRILNSNLEDAEDAVFDVYMDVCVQKGIKRIPGLYISGAVKTPMIYGFCNTKVILPKIHIAHSDISAVLSHELVHYKRGDLYIKLLALVANSLHWFNPLCYIAVKHLFGEMELSCDEKVLENSDKEARISYGVAMLEIVKKCRHSAPSLTTGFNPKSRAVKARFENILDTAKKRKGIPLIIIMLCISILSANLVGYGSESGTISTEKPSEVVKEEETNYTLLFRYERDVEDIQPLYDIMDDSMESFAISMLTDSNGKHLIDYNGEIKADLPESDMMYKYCSVCCKITDHISCVDPNTFEVYEINSGHGGGYGRYIYDSERSLVAKYGIGGYAVCQNIDFAIVGEAVLISGNEGEISENYESEVYEEDYPGVISSYKDERGVVFHRYADQPEGCYNETGKFGIVNNGKLVTELVYDGYLDFDDYGICALKKDGKWGYYDHEGNMILDHLYDDASIQIVSDYVQTVPYSSSCGIIALNRNGKWGYADTKGNIIVDCVFEEARPVSSGKAWVKDEKGWMVISFNNFVSALSTAEAVELADDYLKNFYYSDPGPAWKILYNGEEEFYGTSCYYFTAKIDGGENGVDYTHEIAVTFDKRVYQLIIERDELYIQGD